MTYSLGVDGGGTKTESILIDAAGAILARQIGPGCNPSVVGPEQARKTVAESLRLLLAPLSERDPGYSLRATLLCMAGSRSFWQEFAGSLTAFGRVVAVDDSLPVLELATGGEPGLVLHAGTGSFVAARAPAGPSVPAGLVGAAGSGQPGPPFGFVHYAGGLGWRFGDEGGGYDLGRRAVGRGLLELQGWLPSSGLSAYLIERTGMTEAIAVSRYFYQDSAANGRIAELAPGVLELANLDAAALEIVVRSVGPLLELALLVSAKLFAGSPLSAVPAGLSGPILNHPAVVAALSQRSELRLKPVADPPIEGVRRLLLRLS
jgi:glucosamine kinase